MVESRKLEKIQCAARCAALQIGRAIDNPRKTSMDHRAGAHWTRLFSDVQGAVDQPPVAHYFFRLGQRQHFGVGRGILQHLHLIESAANDSTFPDHHRADRHFLGFIRLQRLA
jgi:hypothetical protein